MECRVCLAFLLRSVIIQMEHIHFPCSDIKFHEQCISSGLINKSEEIGKVYWSSSLSLCCVWGFSTWSIVMYYYLFIQNCFYERDLS